MAFWFGLLFPLQNCMDFCGLKSINVSWWLLEQINAKEELFSSMLLAGGEK